jgi:hypothetical protein
LDPSLGLEARRNYSGLKAAIILAAGTGMRQDEIYGLVWQAVDFSRSAIMLERTKTGKARTIPMSQTVRNLSCLCPRTASESWLESIAVSTGSIMEISGLALPPLLPAIASENCSQSARHGLIYEINLNKLLARGIR